MTDQSTQITNIVTGQFYKFAVLGTITIFVGFFAVVFLPVTAPFDITVFLAGIIFGMGCMAIISAIVIRSIRESVIGLVDGRSG